MPLCQRHVIVQPRLKKTTADLDDVTSYRSISNLTFMSKIMKKLVCRQITGFLENNGLLPKMQSAYRRYNSTETTVLKIVSDILCAADRGDATFLCLLDMSAAFDTVDHDILVERLEKAFGHRGKVLEWIKSFLLTRTQTMMLNGKQSSSSELLCGVPQGSVLGPISPIYCRHYGNRQPT